MAGSRSFVLAKPDHLHPVNLNLLPIYRNLHSAADSIRFLHSEHARAEREIPCPDTQRPKLAGTRERPALFGLIQSSQCVDGVGEEVVQKVQFVLFLYRH